VTEVPKWLQAHLERCGRWDVDRVTRKAAVSRCPGCKRRVWKGLDADLIAGVAIADPWPVSMLGEAAAHIIGLNTYSLHWNLDHVTLDLRTSYEIRAARRPGVTGYDVLAQHDCGVIALPRTESIYADSKRPDYSGPPPY
jgi:hypothetical protein